MYYAIVDTEGGIYCKNGLQFAYAIVTEDGDLVELHYYDDITSHIVEANQQFLRSCNNYGVSLVCGYKVSHDESVLNEAADEDSCGWVKKWLSARMTWSDLMSWTRDVVNECDDFSAWINSDDRRSRFGVCSFANVYTYITKNHDYKQTHNAMQDVLDEIQLFKWLQEQ